MKRIIKVISVTIAACLIAGFIVLFSIVNALSNRFEKIYHQDNFFLFEGASGVKRFKMNA
jgi:hypothetical protein